MHASHSTGTCWQHLTSAYTELADGLQQSVSNAGVGEEKMRIMLAELRRLLLSLHVAAACRSLSLDWLKLMSFDNDLCLFGCRAAHDIFL